MAAQFNLGVGYNNGEGVEQDFEEAIRLYKLAADDGNLRRRIWKKRTKVYLYVTALVHGQNLWEIKNRMSPHAPYCFFARV